MKFTAEKLFEIAMEEVKAAGFDMEEQEGGAGEWAHYSADQEYDDEEEVREEIRGLFAANKEIPPEEEDEECRLAYKVMFGEQAYKEKYGLEEEEN